MFKFTEAIGGILNLANLYFANLGGFFNNFDPI